MENYLIIDDVDTCFIQQNSWIILLERQILRNFSLLKLYEIDKYGKKSKIYCKDLMLKIKSSINKSIKARIKNRKNSENLSNQNDPTSFSLSLRRKTEEVPKKTLQRLVKNVNSSYSKQSHSLAKMGFQTSQRIQQCRHQSRYFCQEQKSEPKFLPFEASSALVDQDLNLLKPTSKNSLQKIAKPPKPFLQAKPILSLHELQFSTKQFCFNDSMNFQKRLTHIQKLLIRSSMNSPKKCLNTENDGSCTKKSLGQLPQIRKSDSNKLYTGQFMSKIHKFESQFKEKSMNSQKSQQTKESDSQNLYGLESIIEYCMKSVEKQESFEDQHISKNNLIKNYRISKIRNIKFPVQ